MFPSIKRTINFEVVKTPKDGTITTSEPKPVRSTEEIAAINAIFIVNAGYLAGGLVAMYAAIKTIDTVSKIAVIKAASNA